MRITSISITNLAAFTEWKSMLPAVAVITGAHGVGKSSLESVLMYAFGRRPLAAKGSRSVQHDPGMLHGQAEKGEAIVTFDDGDIESLRVVVKPDSTSRTVKMRGAKRWEDAGQLIDDITNALAYNPMAFRDLEPKERIEAFLKAVPVQISIDEVVTAIGGVIPFVGVPSLEAINAAYDDIYKGRTSANVSADTQRKYAEQLEAALPPQAPGEDWDAEVARLRNEKAALESSEADEIKRIGREFQAAKDAAAQVRQSTGAALNEALLTDIGLLDEQIRQLEARKSKLREAVTGQMAIAADKETQANEAARAVANAEAKEIREANAPLHARLATEIATADERARATAQAEGTRKAAKEAREEADRHKKRAADDTAALERLTALKVSVAGRMQVKGVTIASPRAGLPVDICREQEGALVPFSRWNSADQDQFCLKMATLFRGPCGIVCVDNMGNWAESRQESVIAICRKYAASSGMQFLLGLASDEGALMVKDVT